MKKKIITKIGEISFLAIPAGLISWIFWADGWKVTVVGTIVFVTMCILRYAIENSEVFDD